MRGSGSLADLRRLHQFGPQDVPLTVVAHAPIICVCGFVERAIGRPPCGAGLAAALKPPRAGLPPRGRPSLTQDRTRLPIATTAHPISQISKLSSTPLCRAQARRRFTELVISIRPHPVRSHRQTAFADSEVKTPPLLKLIRTAWTRERTMCGSARPGFRERTNPALEWAFLGSSAAFHDQPARGSLRKRATSSASPAR